MHRLIARVKNDWQTRMLPARVKATIARVRDEKLTYLSQARLLALGSACRTTERKLRRGTIIEAGCALGGSAIVLCAAKSAARPLVVYDTFGMIPAPSGHDGLDVHERYQVIKSGNATGIGGDRYYGYIDDLLSRVIESFHAFGFAPDEHAVTFVKGMFQQTLQVTSPVSLAHIDGDWYESVMTCLTRIEPFLLPGGRLVIDDYFDWSGCRTAVDEYFKHRDTNTYRFERAYGTSRPSLIIVKSA
jgi:asparagine synthase (glutamine-hydrolysing)